jgi:hypothetical protein
MAANSVLLRDGLEKHVSAHSLSFCVHNACTDLNPRFEPSSSDSTRELEQLIWERSRSVLSGGAAAAAGEAARGAGKHGGKHGGASPLTMRMQRLIESRDDGSVATDPWIARAVALVRSGGLAPAWRPAPIGYHAHEGAFYPVWLIRQFVRAAFEGSPFAAALRRQQAGSACPCCALYQTNTSWQGLGSCCLEEWLLPTYVWQTYPHLLPTAAPPTIVRVWTDVNKPDGAANLTRTACRLLSPPRGLRHLYGIKVPHFFFGRVSGVLQNGGPLLRPPARAARRCQAAQGGGGAERSPPVRTRGAHG